MEKKIQYKKEKIKKALPELKKILQSCELCNRRCRVNRYNGDLGFCRAGIDPSVYSFAPHHGEEPPVSGLNGSGTIFFSHCPMGCVYCQNYKFSQRGEGEEVSIEKLARIMLELQNLGCHNINLVTPTHFTSQIVEALDIAYSEGLELPIVYNTGGYDSFETIKLLDGIVDIYLPDMKYASDNFARKYSDSPEYAENNKRIVREMFRQVGNLTIKNGIAKKGIIIRLLILPNNISETEKTLEFIAEFMSEDVYLSVMSQYYPAHSASRYRELSRRITKEEYGLITRKMEELGLKNGWLQPFQGDFDPNFAGENFKPNI